MSSGTTPLPQRHGRSIARCPAAAPGRAGGGSGVQVVVRASGAPAAKPGPRSIAGQCLLVRHKHAAGHGRHTVLPVLVEAAGLGQLGPTRAPVVADAVPVWRGRAADVRPSSPRAGPCAQVGTQGVIDHIPRWGRRSVVAISPRTRPGRPRVAQLVGRALPSGTRPCRGAAAAMASASAGARNRATISSPRAARAPAPSPRRPWPQLRAPSLRGEHVQAQRAGALANDHGR